MTLKFDLASLPADKEALALKASLLKRNCFASVFEKYFKVTNHYGKLNIFRAGV